MRRYKTGEPLHKSEVVVIFQANMARPIEVVDPNTGTRSEASATATAGEEYVISKDHPCYRDWLDGRWMYHADGKQPAPPETPPFISSPRKYTEADFKEQNALVDNVVDRLVAKPLIARLLERLGLTTKAA